MLISNFNLCKSEWLELVFAKRNKEYGAYYIRQHYADNVVKAMLITFFSITVTIAIVGVLIRVKPITEIMVPVDNSVYVIPPAPPKPVLPKPEPQRAAAAAKPAASVSVIKNLSPVVTSEPVVDEMPKIDELKGATGPTETKGTGAGEAPGTGVSKGGDGPAVAAGGTDNTTYKFAEVMPQPVGGSEAWAKFLQKNLHYPGEALEREMSGLVFVSFIVEKDGHLSSIKVERGPGYGLDEEAARVLKLAKPWTPGMQNGQHVRVKLTLPVRFSLDN
ncbi:energy transducer TonB [Mucilaginibacter sp. UR6-11]|uniref:energy transducer TonB n=1 Tax=Mucilaginibacter sp. UR6-11 TaxID=1435644 RepID=UPI001E51808D|nr:energy transducer TonB [Mucilaginibacter sp. UR6-11]MCC8426106.1 TonB family protein [Mucilaginibacter sp. UR6-11]